MNTLDSGIFSEKENKVDDCNECHPIQFYIWWKNQRKCQKLNEKYSKGGMTYTPSVNSNFNI